MALFSNMSVPLDSESCGKHSMNLIKLKADKTKVLVFARGRDVLFDDKDSKQVSQYILAIFMSILASGQFQYPV